MKHQILLGGTVYDLMPVPDLGSRTSHSGLTSVGKADGCRTQSISADVQNVNKRDLGQNLSSIYCPAVTANTQSSFSVRMTLYLVGKTTNNLL